jgi:signal transduction histidine kinase
MSDQDRTREQLLEEVHALRGRLAEREWTEQERLQAHQLEAVGRLAGGVAHQFNNLLTVILGYSDLVLMDLPAGDPAHPLLAEVKKAADRAANLTRQLLAFARRQMIRPRVVDLNAIVADVEPRLRELLGGGIELATRLVPDVGPVNVDPGHMAQVLLDLAANARDAMPGGGRLDIHTTNLDLDEAGARTLPETRPGRYVLLHVSDTGHGMDEATRARVFEPFFTTKPIGQATGLGLAMVYGFLKQSGGHVSVQSEPGRGATFRVYLPQTESAVPAAPPPGTSPAPQPAEG